MVDVSSKTRTQPSPEMAGGPGPGRPRSQGFFEAMVQHLPEAVAVLCEGSHVHCNPAYARLFGFSSPAQVVGRELKELLAPGQAADILARVRLRAEGSANAWSQAAEGRTQQGETFSLELSGHPFQQGKTLYYTLAAKDLSGVLRAEQAIKKNEWWWWQLLRMSLVGMGILSREGRIVAANDALCDLLGQSQETLLGSAWSDFGTELELADLLDLTQRDLEERWAFSPHASNCWHSDGSTLPVKIDVRPIFAVDGQVDQIIVLVQDARHDQQTKAGLPDTEDRYRQVFEDMSEGYGLHEIICDAAGHPVDYRFLEVNPAWERCTGLKRDQVVGRTVREVLPGIEDSWIETYGQVALMGQPLRFDQFSGLLGKHFSVLAQCPKQGLFSTVFLDISALKQQEEQNTLLLAACDQSPASIVITDKVGDIEYVNAVFTRVTGYTAEEALGQNPRILKSGVQGPEVYEDLWRTLRDGKTWKGQFCNKKKNGELYWEQARVSPLFEAGQITHFLAVKEDITAQRALHAAQERLAEAVNEVTELVLITDTYGRLTYSNPAFSTITGLESAKWMGRRVLALLPEAERTAQARTVLKGLKEGHSWHGRLRLLGGNGSICILSGSVSLVRPERYAPFLVYVFQDVTTELAMEASLRQVEKMDALGALAGGIAHDFNNVLSAIMSSAELIDWQLPPDSPLRSKLAVILQAANRAKDLNRRILTFSRPTEERRIPFDLTAVVRECAHLLKSSASHDVEIRSTLTSSVWTTGDPGQIHQVVMNLAVNAIQAIEGRGWVELGLAEIDAGSESAVLAKLNAPRVVQLTVRDSGHGMDPQTLEHVFEPFFTTKKAGGGTGLGLSVVHNIVTQHEGRLFITSEPGQGTLVRILLPCSAPQGPASAEDAQELPRGTEHILVVDQEEVRVALTKESLKNLGYQVTSQADPREALAAFKEHPAIYDAVLLAYTKGAVSALDFATRVRKLRPNIAIILASGSLMEPGADSLFDEMLAKPVTLPALAQALRRGLAAHLRTVNAVKVDPGAAPVREQSGLGEILLAEDSPVTLALLSKWLVQAGYRVKEARDGQEAWEFFTEQGSAAFAMVLSDVVMPRMDGIRLVERIREVDPEIPVVLLSSSEDVQAMKAALNLHVSEFLAKPFDSEALVGCVERQVAGLSLRQRSEETAEAVRTAQRALIAKPEKDLPIYSAHQSLTDAGGDVFWCYKQPDGSILFILADVAGHSVISSYAVAAFLGLLSSQVSEFTDLSDLARRLNRGILDGPFSEVPVCAILGNWKPRTGHLHVLNAGLPHGLCGGLSRRLRIAINGTPLGAFEEPLVEEKVLLLEAGERVFFATDGFFDAHNRAGDCMEEMALNLWSEMGDVLVQEAVTILAGIARTLPEAGLEDDLLAVGFEQPPPEAGSLRLSFPSDDGAIDQAILRLKDYLGRVPRGIPLTQSRRFDILTAAREALTNALLHGNQGRADARIGLYGRWEQAPPRLILEVLDEGLGFDLEALQPPTDPMSERGRGIPILRHYGSSVAMQGGNLTITFSWEE